MTFIRHSCGFSPVRSYSSWKMPVEGSTSLMVPKMKLPVEKRMGLPL